MATKTTAAASTAAEALDPNERVAYKLTRYPGIDEYQYVSVNEYSCNIKRGEKVMIPRFVAEELDRSEAAREARDAKIDTLLEQSK